MNAMIPDEAIEEAVEGVLAGDRALLKDEVAIIRVFLYRNEVRKGKVTNSSLRVEIK